MTTANRARRDGKVAGAMMPAKVFTPAERRAAGRCMDCEWDPPTQGHHELCPAKPGRKRRR